ncbi:hypothetical protein K438DRAFT_1783649 [Mycena galopus ATCC 62051]|nr:hypothetical protein K438DRAFT_1783649 [Mycena galopus ATCC 62051]
MDGQNIARVTNVQVSSFDDIPRASPHTTEKKREKVSYARCTTPVLGRGGDRAAGPEDGPRRSEARGTATNGVGEPLFQSRMLRHEKGKDLPESEAAQHGRMKERPLRPGGGIGIGRETPVEFEPESRVENDTCLEEPACRSGQLEDGWMDGGREGGREGHAHDVASGGENRVLRIEVTRRRTKCLNAELELEVKEDGLRTGADQDGGTFTGIMRM